MKPKRLALFGPNNPFYLDVLFGLARAFNGLGIKTNVSIPLLEPRALNSFCLQFKPSVVLEINRSRSDLPEFPKEVAHICWSQDYDHGMNQKVSISELTYFMTDPATLGFKINPHRFNGMLLPGVDPTAYFPGERRYLSDFSFIGFIPLPFTPEFLASKLVEVVETGAHVTRGEVVHRLMDYYNNPDHSHYHIEEIHNLVYLIIEKALGFRIVQKIDPGQMNAFDKTLIRIVDRSKLLDAVLTVSKGMRIFGPPDWLDWPQYKPFYQRYLYDQQEIREVFHSTRINLHNNCNGFSMHFRVLDCMASGCCIFVNESTQDGIPGGIRNYFEPGAHYISYKYRDVADLAREHLPQADKLERIGREASKAILAGHTWMHRAKQILEDLNRF